MKTILTKAGYMVIGSLLTLIGYHFGNIDNNSADAQLRGTPQELEIVDEIRCRSLVIVGEDDTPRILLVTNLLDRGGIEIYNEDGKPRVFLGAATGYDTGLLQILAKESGGTAAVLRADENGGSMALFNNSIDKNVLRAGITTEGEGFINARDKAGNQTEVIGPQGLSAFQDITRN